MRESKDYDYPFNKHPNNPYYEDFREYEKEEDWGFEGREEAEDDYEDV